MNRFNLTFKGEIHAGRDPQRTRTRVGELLGIDDPAQLENYFSGQSVVLLGNLDRKAAAEYFSKLKKLGLEVELVKITAAQLTAALVEAETPAGQQDTAPDKHPDSAPDNAISKAQPQPSLHGGQSWAVSYHTLTAKTSVGQASTDASDTLERERRVAEKMAIVEAEQAAERERVAQREAADTDARKLVEQKKAARQQALREQLEREVAEEQRKKEKEAARLKALREEEKRRKEEEAAQQKALRDEEKRQTAEAKRNKKEEAARLKALREEEKRKAEEEKRRQDEEAARQKELFEEQERQAAEEKRRKEEEAERLKAEREERERKAAEEKRRKEEEAARLKAEREERERKAAEEKRRKEEEAARLKAEREERERKAAEEKRRKEEEAARLKAEREERERKAAEEKRRKEEEAARLKAEREERERKAAEEKRRKEEEAARLKAEREERERKAAEEKRRKEEAARLKAEEERRKKEEEEQRLRVEEAARQQMLREAAEREASEEAAKRKAVEEAARHEARLAESKRREAEDAERRAHEEAAALRAVEESARREVERARQKLKAAEEAEIRAQDEAAKLKAAEEVAQRRAALAAEEARKAELARIKAVKAEQDAQRIAMEEAAVQRAAQELSRQPSLKPVEARVKTRLEVPRGKSIATDSDQHKPVASPRQPGVPNIYSLQAFRNTPEIQARAATSANQARKAFTIAVLALAALLIAGASYLGLPEGSNISGAHAMAIAPQSGPMLLAGDRLLLHDRAGVGEKSIALQDLGVTELTGPVLFNKQGQLLAPGQLATTGAATGNTGPGELLRCSLQAPGCEIFSTDIEIQSISALAEHPLTADLFLADAEAGQLLQLSKEGDVLARADVPIPEHPVLQLASGLLFMNSQDGPAISVLRYDEGALGQQLDEILLLPPPALEAGQTRVWDFARNTQQWWVTMYNPETNEAGLYRFDDQWNYTGQVELAEGYWPEQLGSWGSKILVRDSHHLTLQRFNSEGVAEVALASDLLGELADIRQREVQLRSLAWRSGLLVVGLLTLGGFCMGYLFHVRSLVYRPHRERGADPVDGLAAAVNWIAPVADRTARIRRREAVYGIFGLAALGLAIAQGVSVLQLAALLLALGGPAIACVLFSRSPLGHIGVLPGLLLLADHAGVYHLGSDARLQYRGPFLLVDDVVVFTGSWLLPAFAPEQVAAEVQPLASAGIRVDRKTVFIKLLQGRHPLALGAIATVTGLLLAGGLLALAQ